MAISCIVVGMWPLFLVWLGCDYKFYNDCVFDTRIDPVDVARYDAIP